MKENQKFAGRGDKNIIDRILASVKVSCNYPAVIPEDIFFRISRIRNFFQSFNSLFEHGS